MRMSRDKSLARHTALSPKTKPSKELLSFIETYDEFIPGRTKILDFGAGRGRHTNALRELGFSVYSYDPYLGAPDADPYNGTTSIAPTDDAVFDLVFTAFVLNVVDEADMYGILDLTEQYTADGGFTAHIVREDLRKLKGGTTVGKGGAIQRDIPVSQLTDIGYERIGKVFVKPKT